MNICRGTIWHKGKAHDEKSLELLWRLYDLPVATFKCRPGCTVNDWLLGLLKLIFLYFACNPYHWLHHAT